MNFCDDKFLEQFNIKQLKQLSWMLQILNIPNVDTHISRQRLVNNILDHNFLIDNVKKLLAECSGKKYVYRCYGSKLKEYHVIYTSTRINISDKDGWCKKCGNKSLIYEFINEFENFINRT